MLPKKDALIVGLTTAALVYGIHNVMLPSAADVRASEAADPDIATVERQATAVSAAAVAGISLLARDPTVFIIGGTTVVLLAWLNKSANLYDPLLGRTRDYAQPMTASVPDGTAVAG